MNLVDRTPRAPRASRRVSLAVVTMILETERLMLREFALDDADFMLAVLNDPDFVRYVGDRRVRTSGDARGYLQGRVLASYERHGFGMYLAVRKSDGATVGICGLVKRDSLEDADIGYAFLPAYRGHGYARECAGAVLDLARVRFGLRRVVAIVDPDNADSIRVLESLNMTRERGVRFTQDGPELLLYVSEA
jgi:[ribosomal protein S5]-alanine N-acetyltransferase